MNKKVKIFYTFSIACLKLIGDDRCVRLLLARPDLNRVRRRAWKALSEVKLAYSYKRIFMRTTELSILGRNFAFFLDNSQNFHLQKSDRSFL